MFQHTSVSDFDDPRFQLVDSIEFVREEGNIQEEWVRLMVLVSSLFDMDAPL